MSMNYNLAGKKSTIKVGALRNNEKHTKINIEKWITKTFTEEWISECNRKVWGVY